MARHKTRRETMNSRKHDFESANHGYKSYVLVFGVMTCVIFAAYFAFSTPDPGGKVVKSQASGEWHEQKHIWSLKPISDKQFNIIKDLVKIERLKNEYLRYLLVVRTPGSPEIKEVKRFIGGTMRSLGWVVEHDTFIDKPPHPHDQTEFSNIIATYNPKARRRLVLACHYDSKLTPEGFIGATDSAVPCAMMLEIAKVLQDYLALMPQDSDITLQYIFFDGEEAFVQWTATDSIYGARHLAAKWARQKWPPNTDSDKTVLDSIDVLVLLDLLGGADPRFFDYQSIRSRHYKELTRIEQKLKDKKTYFHARSSYGAVEDDHIPFLRRNVPVLHIIPNPFPPQWHKIEDNEENLDDYAILRLTRILAVFVTEYLHLEPKAF